MKMPGLGLRGRLVGAVSIVLAGLLAVTAMLVVLRAEEALEDAERSRFAAVTGQLAESIRYPVLARSPALLKPSLDVFARTPDLVEVEVLDEKRAVLTRSAGLGTHLARVEGEVRVEVPVRTRADAPGDEDGELATFGVESARPRLVGFVVARFSTATTARIQAQVRRDILGAFVIVGGVGLLIVLALASSVVRRARQLAGAAAQVARGELEVRVEAHGQDELAALARDFNAMTAALAEQRNALDDAAEQLAERESLAAIGRATAVIAHELKNPLGILLGAAEIAGNPDRPETARRKAAQIIVEEVPRLERTLNELLHYARPNKPKRVAVDAVELSREAAERATHPGGPAAGLDIQVQGPAHQALVDEHQARQVLLNLLTNAAQAGAQRVEMSVRADGSRVAIDVKDDGPGVAESIRRQLFRPFVTTKQRGVGLGLAGSRRQLRDNGGDLRFLDSDGGAHFVVLLAAPEAEERAP